MIKAKITHMTDNTEHNEQVWGQIVEQLANFWEGKGADLYQREANLSASALIEGWSNRTLIIVLAEDEDGKTVGLGLGIQFRHILYSSAQLVIEVLQADSQEAYNEILKTYATFVEVNGIDKVYIPVHKRDKELMNIIAQSGFGFISEDDISQKCINLKM